MEKRAALEAKKLTNNIRSIPIDPRSIAENQGLEVSEQPLSGFLGVLLIDGDLGVIAIDENIKESGRKNFTIAHELGHFVCHRALRNKFSCQENDIFGSQGGKLLEREANSFAAEILMPERFFGQSLAADEESYDLVPRLAEAFGTTLTATAIRYVDLAQNPCAVVLSENRQISWHRKSSDFKYDVLEGALSENSYADDFYAGKSLPKENKPVYAGAWLRDVRPESGTIVEASYPLAKYKKVLTLLWLEAEATDHLEEFDDATLDGRLRFKR